jgi:hypothetical protein
MSYSADETQVLSYSAQMGLPGGGLVYAKAATQNLKTRRVGDAFRRACVSRLLLLGCQRTRKIKMLSYFTVCEA